MVRLWGKEQQWLDHVYVDKLRQIWVSTTRSMTWSVTQHDSGCDWAWPRGMTQSMTQGVTRSMTQGVTQSMNWGMILCNEQGWWGLSANKVRHWLLKSSRWSWCTSHPVCYQSYGSGLTLDGIAAGMWLVITWLDVRILWLESLPWGHTLCSMLNSWFLENIK